VEAYSLANQRIEAYRKVFERAGLATYVSRYPQRDLLGNVRVVDVVTAVAGDGATKLRLVFMRGAPVRLLMIHHADSADEAEELAEALEDLGISADVDGDRVLVALTDPDLDEVAKLVEVVVGRRATVT
jgi:hypothetical protein